MHRQIEDKELNRGIGEDFISFCSRDELDVEMSAKHLLRYFKESQITKLVRSGYLTSEVTGKYSLGQQFFLDDSSAALCLYII